MKNDELVTASEIGDWAFCPESVRLRALGHKTANQPFLDAGTKHHAKKQTAERQAGISITAGCWLIGAALIMAFLLWVTF